MEISFSLLRSKEVINLFDGKRLGHIVDLVLDKESGKVLGFVVPGQKKLFRKADDLFIPLEEVKKLGEDVILVKLTPYEEPRQKVSEQEKVYARYRRVPQKEK